MGIIVSKFGGSSMKDAIAIRRSAQVAHDKAANVIVVSATYGTTNLLIDLSQKAKQGHWNECQTTLKDIREKHLRIANDLEAGEKFIPELNAIFTELETLIHGVSLLKDLSAKAFDSIQSVGERSSSYLMTLALSQISKSEVNWLDARTILRTDDQFSKAIPDIEKTRELCKQIIGDATDKVFVTQGFIGANEDGDTTTLGRGGSDYSAALIAEGIGAETLEIWTDVAGIATTDPRLCPEAKPIEQITFKEAAELAAFGGKILHPSTLIPARRANIKVFVGSSYESEKPGTWIGKSCSETPLIRAMATKRNQSIITLTTPKMLHAHGFLANVFTLFDQFKISVDSITTSEIAVALTVDDSTLLNKSFMRELEAFAEVKIEGGLAVISLIGNNINYTPGLSMNIFECLNESDGKPSINVRMICQGASKHNFCFLVADDFAADTIQRLHGRFI